MHAENDGHIVPGFRTANDVCIFEAISATSRGENSARQGTSKPIMTTKQFAKLAASLWILALSVIAFLGLTGCAMNNPKFVSETHSTNGVVEIRKLSVPTFAIWPATTELAKQKASLSAKSFTLGTEGLKEEGGGTNMIEALKALDSILGKVR